MSTSRDDIPPLSGVRLLEALSSAQSRYIATASPAEFFQRLLVDVLALTASEYGFIGELRRDAQGAPYLKTHAITNIAWNDVTRRLYEENAAKGFEFRNLSTLFGHVLRTGEILIANDPAHDPRRGGLPDGHPPMHSFLGVPVRAGDEFIGVVGLSNRPGGYDAAVAEFLQPFLATVGAAITSHRLNLARERAESALRESEERHRTILDTVLDAILTIDEKGTIETCNPAAETMFGWTRDELVGRNVRTIMPDPWSSAHDGYLARYVATDEAHVLGSTREVTALRRDGSTFPASLALNEARLPSGRRFVGVLRDVTHRKMSEDALLSASSRLTTLIESLQASVLLETESRRIALVNRRFCEVFRIPVDPSQLVGMDCTDAAERSKTLFRDPEGFVRRISEVLAARETVRAETVEMADGRVLERDFVPLWTGGQYAGHFWQYRDVTDRTRAVEGLRVSESRKSGILDSSLDAVITIDHEGRVLDFNPAAERMFGWTRAEMAGQLLGERIVPERLRRAHAAGMETFLRTGHGPVLGRMLELPALRRDGTEFPVELSIAAIAGAGAAVFTAHLRDITERKSTEKALHDARDAAERASRFKSDFLASMSHEIRTPMTAIVGYSDMLGRPNVADAAKEDAVLQIRRNADYLLALLNDILDLSKIEAGQMTLHREPTSVASVLAGIQSLLRPHATEKQIRFEVVFDGPVPASVRTDPLRLRQVLMNLTSNAVKFTDRGGVTIVVRFAPPEAPGRPGWLRFAVEDTGIGIDAADLPRLFAAFTQVHSSASRRRGGTGLGLAISRRLAEALGGDVAAVSTPGAGSTFTLRVPVAPEDCAVLDPRPDLARYPQSYRGSAQRLDGRRMLVVDDNPDNQRIERFLLEDAGAAVETADNGRAGADAVLAAVAAGRPFDAVLMDMQMPVLDGYSATAELRRAGVRTPIVAVTAHAMADDAARCLGAGCDAYLSKPIVPDELLTTLGRLVASSAAGTSAAPEPPAAGPPAAEPPSPPPQRPRAVVRGVPRPSAAPNAEFDELVRDYVRQLPEHAAALRAALASGATDPIRLLTHRLRGTGSSLGFPQITAAAAVAEDAVRSGAGERAVADAVNELVRVLDAAGVSAG